MNKIIIPRKKLKGDDGHRTFSVRIPTDLYDKIESLTSRTELSRNEIICKLLEAAVENVEIIDN